MLTLIANEAVAVRLPLFFANVPSFFGKRFPKVKNRVLHL